MGGAMVRGWLNAGCARHITILEPNALSVSDERITHIQTIGGIDAVDIVVLAVKPQVMAEICASIKPYVAAGTPILSIAAGQTTTVLESYLHPGQPVIRSMPNLPAAIGKGMTAAFANEKAADYTKLADTLLKAVGECVWLDDERQMDAVTAISGSGPAYIFYLIEALDEAAQKLGLPAAMSASLAQQTVIGAAALVEMDPGTPASTLRENVTSKGGTTEAALSVLMDGRWQEIINDATAKARARSAALSS
jgi:pyrroline-5-carboxylate reductase